MFAKSISVVEHSSSGQGSLNGLANATKRPLSSLHSINDA